MVKSDATSNQYVLIGVALAKPASENGTCKDKTTYFLDITSMYKKLEGTLKSSSLTESPATCSKVPCRKAKFCLDKHWFDE